MEVNLILISGAALGVLGGTAAVILSVASRIFRVHEDPRIATICDMLPGANCGGCGLPGCSGFAKALVEGKADPSGCPPGGSDLAQKLGEVLGIEVTGTVKQVARIRCNGTPDTCPSRFVYQGFQSCKGASMVAEGGAKACPYGCEGLGDCVVVCPFDAIAMGPGQIPVVDDEKCTGCNKCVVACPKDLICLEPVTTTITLACNTQLPGKVVRKTCKVGCIGCRLCVRTCPYDALTMDGNLPARDFERCVSCGLCVDVCPPKCMVPRPGSEVDPAVRETAEKLVAERKAAEAEKKAAAKRKAAAAKAAAAAATAEGGEPAGRAEGNAGNGGDTQ